MTRPVRWPAVVAASALALDLLVLEGAPSPVRTVVALWFLFVCTGMSFVPLLAISPIAHELLVGVLTSIALDTLVATAIVEVGGLSAASGLIVLEGICLLGGGLQLRRAGLGWRP